MLRGIEKAAVETSEDELKSEISETEKQIRGFKAHKMMNFLGFGAPAAAPEPEEIPEEAALLQALWTAYRNSAITTTKAMHLDVSARHPTWTVRESVVYWYSIQ
jgi:hypothetical protein